MSDSKQPSDNLADLSKPKFERVPDFDFPVGLTSDELFSYIYPDLRAIAQQRMNAERPSHTLTATALVHEVYLKLVGSRRIPWQNRAHFYAAAVEAMRRILLDHARAQQRQKRGKGKRPVSIEDLNNLEDGCWKLIEDEKFIALDEAICRLKEQDSRMAEVVRLRWLAGLTVAETAEVLNISERTVKNDWSFAKAWLARELDTNNK
jgi:RNA polymerase sigma factor (TIGR02999 family)